MSGKSRFCLGLGHTALSDVAKASARFVGRCGRLSLQSVQHAYNAHQERAQMRLARRRSHVRGGTCAASARAAIEGKPDMPATACPIEALLR